MARTLALVIMALAGSSHAVASAASGPILGITSVHGYQYVIRGEDWDPGTVVIFHIDKGMIRQSIKVLTTPRGGFLIGMNHADPCGTLSFGAADRLAHQVQINNPAILCSRTYQPPPPGTARLKVLAGSRVWRRVIDACTSVPAQINLRRGQILACAAPSGQPAPMLHVSNRYFARLELQDLVPCGSEPNCASNGAEEWVAIRAGHTTADWSAACRSSHPACEIPDRLIRVDIRN